MIISKTPYRISFFGGGTDFPEWYSINKGLTISTTIDYYLYITARYLPSFFKNINYRLSYSKIENVKNVEDIKHRVIREYLNYIKTKSPLEMHVDSDLPARSGLGSSSAFIVGLINSFNTLLKQPINSKKLFEKAIYFEQKVLNDFCGSQDQVITALGGFRKITYQKNKISTSLVNISSHRKKKLEESLVIVFTGFSRNATQVEKNKIKLINKKTKNYKEIYSLAIEAKQVFENGKSDLNDIGKLLHESWKIKKTLSNNVSNLKINKIYDYAIANGATGGKILGAGNGGFLLFYVQKKNKKKFLLRMNKFLNFPVVFSNHGSRIIYKSDEKIKV
ncbi:hypothetical protein [Candidatus Pelagibacter communis]|uniref:GHMP family kinase ATP-binding protein n=1 Tax=Pelagibacter ubique TaxID=198252 RepID=UPI000A6416B1|nr:hypothetical protein [Candidatus Pelagibacter ubique]